MDTDNKLRIGDVSDNGQITIIDEDRLCYLVKSESRGSVGLRTISKALLNEYIHYFTEHPDSNANAAREVLCGKTEIDKFEYGYTSTLTVMAKMILDLENVRNENIRKEIVREKYAATFLKKIMRFTLNKDVNFSHFEALKKYAKTSKRLMLNGFGIGCNKEQLPSRAEDYDIDIAWEFDSQEYVLYLEFIPKEMEQRFVPAYNEAYKGLFQIVKEANEDYVLYQLNGTIKPILTNQNKILQQIFYGAPGTGKSNIIKKLVDEQNKRCHRITFHPDSDYSTFVGAYKPTMKVSSITKDGVTTKEEKIVYKFCPQAFTNAYVEAWNTEEEVYLIIEEINRGNCAQIFGDLFQLLDRKNGVSEYPVDADADLAAYIRKELEDSPRQDIPQCIKEGKKLMLPSNLYIWATMNTSDQSLFPIDSAFKRRWEWKYMKIKKGKDELGNELNWKIAIKDNDGNLVKINGEDSLPWWNFIEKINEIIASMTSSADKQLGYFFCKAGNDGEIPADKFVSKVIFYLWNDVFKDYGFEDAYLFQYTVKDSDGKDTEKDLTFPDFYEEDGENINTERLADFLTKVMNWKKTAEDNN